jgi:DNA adenine methylase
MNIFFQFGKNVICNIVTKEHFYYLGAKETNRNAIYEAILSNLKLKNSITTLEMRQKIPNQECLLTSNNNNNNNNKQVNYQQLMLQL